MNENELKELGFKTTKEVCTELNIKKNTVFYTARKIRISSDYFYNNNSYWSNENVLKIKKYRESEKRISDKDKLLIIDRFLSLKNNSTKELIQDINISIDAASKIIDKFLKEKTITVESKMNKK